MSEHLPQSIRINAEEMNRTRPSVYWSDLRIKTYREDIITALKQHESGEKAADICRKLGC